MQLQLDVAAVERTQQLYAGDRVRFEHHARRVGSEQAQLIRTRPAGDAIRRIQRRAGDDPVAAVRRDHRVAAAFSDVEVVALRRAAQGIGRAAVEPYHARRKCKVGVDQVAEIQRGEHHELGALEYAQVRAHLDEIQA